MTSKRIQYDKMRIKRSFLRLNFEMTSRIMFLLSFLALVVMNMRSYSSSPKYIVGLEENDEADRRNTDNRRSFIKVTLATILQKTFSENLQLFNLYNGDDAIIFDLNTPQGKAFDWILSFDEYQHSKTNSEHFDPSDNPTIIQRYILAVLFFATGGEYNRNLGSEFSPQHNKQGSWTSDGMLGFLSKKSHECSWKGEDALKNVKGVTKCDIHTKEVTELILPELSLHGELPEEIGYLSNLVTLDFQNNVLVGSVPQSIGRLTSLRTLELSDNHFVGRLPQTMKSMTELETLYINHNRMEGNESIPVSICELFQEGQLIDLWADCYRPLNPVKCECCTVCCDPFTECSATLKSNST